jgi:hypothetical protein
MPPVIAMDHRRLSSFVDSKTGTGQAVEDPLHVSRGPQIPFGRMTVSITWIFRLSYAQ